MARTLIAANENAAHGGGINDLTFTAADADNDHYFPNDGKTRLLVRCLDSSPHTVTVVSVTDSYGRDGDITLTVPAATAGVPGLAYAGPFNPGLFNQRGADDLGNVHVDISDETDLAFAVVSDA
jgi:hypothetical protein